MNSYYTKYRENGALYVTSSLYFPNQINWSWASANVYDKEFQEKPGAE